VSVRICGMHVVSRQIAELRMRLQYLDSVKSSAKDLSLKVLYYIILGRASRHGRGRVTLAPVETGHGNACELG
jgi:hypothetical protein